MKLRDRFFLIKTIDDFRKIDLTYGEILEELTNLEIKPKKWYSEKHVRQFYSNYKYMLKFAQPEKETQLEVFDFIKPLIKNMQISDRDKFNIYFWRLSVISRIEFFKWLAVPYMQKGIPITEICTAITKDFKKIGFLSDHTIRYYMPNKFKDTYQRERRLGKTFEKQRIKSRQAV